MSLDAVLRNWKHDPLTAPNIPVWRTLPPRPAQTHPFPDDLPAPLRAALTNLDVPSLYSHQLQAWAYAREGRNLVLATGTASGKTLAYNLPVLAALLEDENTRALYLFPTKALTQDQYSVVSNQLSVLRPLNSGGGSLNTGIYDGDTPSRDRSSIRKNARVVLTNPDMLHTGILPHHTNWGEFFRNLKFVVIDELHTYRGVFGSHVANVIRRLKRVAAFYGANPQFILTSATIGNPQELAEKLIEAPVSLIDEDGAARGTRHFLIYNPPVVNESLGLRKSALLESVRLAQDLLSAGVQSVVFARSRRSVEIILTYLQNSENLGQDRGGGVRGYRSGYLPSQRREIEKGLRDGTVQTVVATNALELGIDIGGLGAAILVGYPGTVASAWQQAGRAGRGDAPAAAALVASSLPLDQFLAHHPEYFLERSPEQALINPDHLLILLEHLRCAMFELPFEKGERFGGLDVDEFLEFLVANREAHFSNDKFFWMADQYPAASISLRSASPESITLQVFEDASDSLGASKPFTIGTVDGESAAWMVHPGAVYLHEAQSYFVERLDLDQKIAVLRPALSDYYTEPLRDTTVTPLALGEWRAVIGGEKSWGELQVTTRVKGFIKRRWYTHETLGGEPLDLPPQDLQTTGYWLSVSNEAVKALADEGLWTNAPNDYGPHWPQIRERVRKRDDYKCQMCGRPELNHQHDVHHKIPFRMFRDENGSILRERANQLDNLITLCPECHKKAETAVRVRSGLAGLSYVLGNLAPLFLMCDPGDLGTHIEPVGTADFPKPAVVLYDLVPAGIGFSEKLFELHDELIQSALELVSQCGCVDGCPSCVGPGGENGMGGKQETLAILKELVKNDHS